jgi:hypothetical protein
MKAVGPRWVWQHWSPASLVACSSRSPDPTLDMSAVQADLKTVTASGNAVHATPRYPGGDYVLLGELCLLGRFIEVPDVSLPTAQPFGSLEPDGWR